MAGAVRNPRARRWAVVPQSVVDRVRRLCEVHKQCDVAQIVGVAQSEISKMKARGWRAAVIRAERPMPGCFPIMAHRLSPKELTVHYRCSYRCIKRWRAALDNPPKSKRGIALRNRPRGTRPMPPGFEAYQVGRKIEELKAHYRCGSEALHRWFGQMETPRVPVYVRRGPKEGNGNAN